MAQHFVIFLHRQAILAVDVTEVDPTVRLSPPGGELQTVLSLRFHRWKSAAEFFAEKGARPDEVEKAWTLDNRKMIAELTIP
jgi:hypothetical protein